jgi:hypothetical protein
VRGSSATWWASRRARRRAGRASPSQPRGSLVPPDVRSTPTETIHFIIIIAVEKKSTSLYFLFVSQLLIIVINNGAKKTKTKQLFVYSHYHRINYPTTEAQAFLITHKKNGLNPTTRAQCALVGAKDCKCSRDRRLNVR